jgi:AraC family ethanolamine operon transcriptional activator
MSHDSTDTIEIPDGVSRISLPDAEIQGGMKGSDARYLQLSPGKYLGTFNLLSIPGMKLVKEHQNQTILKQMALSPDVCTISFIWGEGPVGRLSNQRLIDRHVIYLPADMEIDAQIHANVGVTMFSFDKDIFLAAAMALDEAYWLIRGGSSFLVVSNCLEQLASYADSVLQWAAIPACDRPWIRDRHMLLNQCLSHTLMVLGHAADATIDYKENISRDRALRTVRRAREFMGCRFGESITILDVCRNIGVSRRTLQFSFEKIMQVSPVQYLRLVRLNRARHLLREATPTTDLVGDVAFRCGFWHLSKFAQDYRRMFGELPSDTLRRSASNHVSKAFG